jgi:hypothetical protein
MDRSALDLSVSGTVGFLASTGRISRLMRRMALTDSSSPFVAVQGRDTGPGWGGGDVDVCAWRPRLCSWRLRRLVAVFRMASPSPPRPTPFLCCGSPRLASIDTAR